MTSSPRSGRELADRLVVITGGARGIGRATAERLVAAGAHVVLGDRDEALVMEVASALGPSATGCRLDVTDPADWKEAVARSAEIGPIDALVNNAGIMPLGPVVEESSDVARAIVDVNLHGVINGTKAVAPGMIARGRGHVVNIASAVGRVAAPHGATYSASKFAVVGFTEATRGELAPHGVDVSMVLPTVVRTDLSAGVPAARGVRPVTAEQVAEVVESVLRRPRVETWVPRWSRAIARTADMLPRRVRDGMAHAMKADAVLAQADRDSRSAYEERARRVV